MPSYLAGGAMPHRLSSTDPTRWPSKAAIRMNIGS